MRTTSTNCPTTGSKSDRYLFKFMGRVITRLTSLGKDQTAEIYSATLRSFQRFRCGRDVTWRNLTSNLMMEYEAWLRAGNVSTNTISFYNRILRAVYNRAVEAGLAKQEYPFKHVYTGIDRTVKRAIPLKYIRRMKALDLSDNEDADFARDMFLFSFYTRGMSFIDMAYLKKSNLRGGSLTYTRRKTGQRLTVKWEACMQDIVDKYSGRLPRHCFGMEHFSRQDLDPELAQVIARQTAESSFLLPIIARAGDEQAMRQQYKSAIRVVNKSLKTISALIGLETPLTTYVSRHSWASIAKTRNIPLSIISEGLGHDSELTTRIYLTSLDTAVVDKANHSILKML
ncbi:MAG: site-specific integrase [Bacteroidales bacterium]|nr:site-specific integrase [Bacteroidales bacterium]